MNDVRNDQADEHSTVYHHVLTPVFSQKVSAQGLCNLSNFLNKCVHERLRHIHFLINIIYSRMSNRAITRYVALMLILF